MSLNQDIGSNQSFDNNPLSVILNLLKNLFLKGHNAIQSIR